MLKSFIFISLISFSSNIFASRYVDGLKKLNWTQLQANYDVDFEGDQIMFGGHILSILNTCMFDDQTIRTKNLVRIEEQDGDTFVFVGYEYLYKSIYSTRTMVDGDGTIDVPYTIATTRMIRVVANDSDFNGRFLFNKAFTIPSCQ